MFGLKNHQIDIFLVLSDDFNMLISKIKKNYFDIFLSEKHF
jgi:hypothetical protein